MTKPTAARGKAAPAYGTGRSDSGGNGYVRRWAPGHPLAMADGYVYEHRYVWFEHHGAVPDGFEVHHKDEDRSHNDISNLELLTEAEHLAHHNRPGSVRRNQYGTWVIADGVKTCRACGETKPFESFTKLPTGRPMSYCKPCNVKRNGAYRKARRARRRSA